MSNPRWSVRAVRFLLLAVGTTGALLGCATTPAEPEQPPEREPAPEIVVGEDAPDFELPYLRLGTDDAGNPAGFVNDAETFRLSSFLGKRPVCMIMSSYT